MNITKLYPKSKSGFCFINDDFDTLSQDTDRLRDQECLHLISKNTPTAYITGRSESLEYTPSAIQDAEIAMFDRVGGDKDSLIQEGTICLIGEMDEDLNKAAKNLKSYFQHNSKPVEWYDINTLSSHRLNTLSNEKIVIVLCNIVKTATELLRSVVLQCKSQIFLPISNLTIRCSLNAKVTHNSYVERILQSMEHNQQIRKYLLASLNPGECLICSRDEEQIRCFDSVSGSIEQALR